MKHRALKQLLSALLVFVMMIGLIPSSVIPTLALTNVSGTVYADDLSKNDSLNLIGDTILVMNKDLTLSSIEGEAYTLTVQGSGTLTVSSKDCAVAVGTLVSYSDLVITTSSEDHYAMVVTNDVCFDAGSLAVSGGAGIIANAGDVSITADSIVITTDVGTALHGDEVYVTANYLWVENKATKSGGSDQYGISAAGRLALTVTGGTVIGYDDALHVYDENDEFDYHYIYVDGSLTVVSKTGAGMYVPQGIAECYGGPVVFVGDTYGINADDVYFDGGSLTVSGTTGIYAGSGVELRGDDIKITASGERNSGIWCENGYVDLEGRVVINTNGWYGINAATDLSLKEGYFEISGPEGNAQAVKVGGELYMSTSLQIVKPTYGHVNGNNIYGAGDSPAMYLLMYSQVGTVDFLVCTPCDGSFPLWDSSAIYGLPLLSTFESIKWYENGELMDPYAPFSAGNEYSVQIILNADSGYYFTEGVLAVVNGKNASSTATLNGRTQLMIRADLGTCKTAITNIALNITAPTEGNKPSTGVSAPDGAHYGVKSSNVQWMVSNDGINFTAMASGTKFVGGKYYRVYMDVTLSNSNYSFKITTENGTLAPDVLAFVNGSIANVSKAYDQDPEKVITVRFDFGQCNDSIIEKIAIVDIVKPVAGERPSYTANVSGTGYHIDNTKNSYYDAYWKNPPEKWYYVKNGISWWDVTDGGYDYVYENDVFLPGHEYECRIHVRTDDGYEFVMDPYTDPETWPTVTVNGQPGALTFSSASGLRREQEVCYTFTCETTTLSTLMVYGIDTPKKGELPDYTATMAYPNLYEPDTDYGLNGSGIYWYDCEGRQLEEGERFGDAGPYCIAIKFVPASVENGPYVSEFAEEVDVYINGKPIAPYGQWDEVVVGSSTVWPFFTFSGVASDPEIGKTVSGQIISFGEEANDVLLQLFKVNSDTLLYEATVEGNTAEYCFTDVASGVYTLRVSKEKHVAREYLVVVNSGDVELDAKIYLMGDLDGDGSVTISDVTTVLNVLSGSGALQQDIEGDLDGDGSMTISDVTKLLTVLSGTTF